VQHLLIIGAVFIHGLPGFRASRGWQ
jgi:hypothetical protein